MLVLYGDGPERARLEARAPHGVRFAGFEQDRDRLAAALASADVLVHGCPYETFGLGVAEAVACGLPVVVPDAGGARGERRTGRAPRSTRASTPRRARRPSCACSERDPVELRARARWMRRRASRPPEEHIARVVSVYDACCERASPSASRLAVHVSIHDVSPAFADEVDGRPRALPRGRRTARAAGRARTSTARPRCSTTRASARGCAMLQAEGHEVYLHGFSTRARARYDAAPARGASRGSSRSASCRAARPR